MSLTVKVESAIIIRYYSGKGKSVGPCVVFSSCGCSPVCCMFLLVARESFSFFEEANMAIEFRFGRDGKLRPTWYGRYKINGKKYAINLGVKIAGTPPSSYSLKDEGDKAFEVSRARARDKLTEEIEKARSPHQAARLVERIYEIKTGEKIQSIPLNKLADNWAQIPRKRKPNARYAKQCHSTLTRFASFAQDANSNAREIGNVTKTLARSFMDAEEARGVTAKTWNDTLKLLRATFKHLLPEGAVNPFVGIPTRETDVVFRKPFTPEELNAILEAARDDDFIRPVIVAGMCTAMRRGDCCLLKWKDVDLLERFLNVKTNKTGQTVSIPVFPLLYDELKDRTASGKYVFPDQAAMYEENPDGITWRVRKVFAAAGFKDEKDCDEDVIRGKVHADREGGLRRASVRDFHSFRVTWVTLALTAGIPLELVQKVTGHKTSEIVLKHYFQPGQEDFRQALQTAMPHLLTNGNSKTPMELVLEIVEKSSTKTAWRDIRAIRKVLAG
jgi:integrase